MDAKEGPPRGWWRRLDWRRARLVFLVAVWVVGCICLAVMVATKHWMQINITSKGGATASFGHLGLWSFCSSAPGNVCESVRNGGVCDNLNFLKPYFRSYCNRVNYITGLLVTSFVLGGLAVVFLLRHLCKPRATLRSWLHTLALLTAAFACIAAVILWREIKQNMAALHIDYPGLDASVVAPSVSSAASGAALFTAVLALLGAVLVVATPSMASDVDVLAAVEYQ